MLPSPTIRKLIREGFPKPEQADMLQVAEAEQAVWLVRLEKELATIDRVKAQQYNTPSKQERPTLVFTVSGNQSEWEYRQNSFTLKFETHEELTGLWLSDEINWRRRDETPRGAVRQVEQVKTFIDVVKGRLDRKALQEKRKQKLNDLKQIGLTARLKELGAKHRFSFRVDQSTNAINLSVRVEGKANGFNFSIPKGKLDTVIEQLPELVATLKNLSSLGVAFRSSFKSWNRLRNDWIDPPTEE